MKLTIAENIRALRKERRLTQEQLAEAMGVTIGAVSKWESSASTPDVGMVVELAVFFETSVDVLLGYDWRGNSMGDAVARIKALRNQKRFDEASAETERALLKYPNCFDVVMQGAVMYCLKGVERHDDRACRRSLELSERSLELIGQNTDEHINEWTIRNNIAEIYLMLGQPDEAIRRMKANNAEGLNNGPIGITLADQHKPDEALPYLSDALVELVSKLFRMAMGYLNAYSDRGEQGKALEVLAWMRGVVEGLRNPARTTYLDMELVQLLTGMAIMSAEKGDASGAKSLLGQAIDKAKAFDHTPSYGFAGMRFFTGNTNATAFDDFGDTALEGVHKALQTQKPPIKETLLGLWDELTRESGAPQEE